MKLFLMVLVILACPSIAIAESDVTCEYAAGGNGKKTRITFNVPELAKFGLLIPVAIKTDDGAPATMNTVIIKDYPYLVLADVYRIETNNSRIALLKISPDKSALEMAYVNMGEKQGAKFYQGVCNTTGGKQ